MGGGKSHEPFKFIKSWNDPVSVVPSSQGGEVFRALMQFCASELYTSGKRARPFNFFGVFCGVFVVIAIIMFVWARSTFYGASVPFHGVCRF